MYLLEEQEELNIYGYKKLNITQKTDADSESLVLIDYKYNSQIFPYNTNRTTNPTFNILKSLSTLFHYGSSPLQRIQPSSEFQSFECQEPHPLNLKFYPLPPAKGQKLSRRLT